MVTFFFVVFVGGIVKGLVSRNEEEEMFLLLIDDEIF